MCGPSCLQGRQYPVEVMYTAAPEDSYVDAALTTVLQVCGRRVPPLGPPPLPLSSFLILNPSAHRLPPRSDTRCRFCCQCHILVAVVGASWQLHQLTANETQAGKAWTMLCRPLQVHCSAI